MYVNSTRPSSPKLFWIDYFFESTGRKKAKWPTFCNPWNTGCMVGWTAFQNAVGDMFLEALGLSHGHGLGIWRFPLSVIVISEMDICKYLPRDSMIGDPMPGYGNRGNSSI